MGEHDTGEKNNPFISDLISAYDMSSSGMGVVLFSLRKLASGKNLTKWELGSLEKFGSNYIGTPYILSWLYPEWAGSIQVRTVKNQSPLATAHKELMLKTNEEYERLEWDIFRKILSGEENRKFKPSGRPFTRDDILTLFQRGITNGLILGDLKLADRIQQRGSNSSLQFFTNALIAGFDFTDKFMEELRKAPVSDTFKGRTLSAATHKLATMLAITDIITYDAFHSGTPIPYSFKPERFDKSWRKMFHKPVPCVGDLYKEAHSVFSSVAKHSDSLVAHLFPLKELPQLVK